MDRSADSLATILNDIQRDLEELKSTQLRDKPVINDPYPVGSIYMSATLSTVEAVSEALGGTWIEWGKGRVPVGVDTSDTDFNSVEKTGGEKTHTLTVNEMPSHNHSIYTTSGETSGTQKNGIRQGRYYGNNDSEPVSNTGGDQAHNNLSPYITCYMFKRTA